MTRRHPGQTPHVLQNICPSDAEHQMTRALVEDLRTSLLVGAIATIIAMFIVLVFFAALSPRYSRYNSVGHAGLYRSPGTPCMLTSVEMKQGLDDLQGFHEDDSINERVMTDMSVTCPPAIPRKPPMRTRRTPRVSRGYRTRSRRTRTPRRFPLPGPNKNVPPEWRCKAYGQIYRTTVNGIQGIFKLKGHGVIFSAIMHPSLPWFSGNVVIYYDDTERLTGTSVFRGSVGSSGIRIDVSFGGIRVARIVGSVDAPGPSARLTFTGSGSWNWT